jgi:hypothetical protein
MLDCGRSLQIVRRSKSLVANTRARDARLVLEHLSLQQIHGDEVLTVRFINLMDRADVRMIERGGSASIGVSFAFVVGIVIFGLI